MYPAIPGTGASAMRVRTLAITDGLFAWSTGRKAWVTRIVPT
jgi:hypothetical protein